MIYLGSPQKWLKQALKGLWGGGGGPRKEVTFQHLFSPWNWLIAFSLPPKEPGNKGQEITHHTPPLPLLPHI